MKKTENSEEWLKNLPVQTENVGFQSEEMIRCAKCGRTNPPTRGKCFYCAAELEVSEAQERFLKPNLRKLETWEKGFNLIFTGVSPQFDETGLKKIAGILKTEKEFLNKIIAAGKALPLARAESEKEAEVVRNRLTECGAESFVLSDEKLMPEKPPQRLRGIEFFVDKLILTLFNRDEIVEIGGEDLTLIVAGATFERRIEATEKHGKKGEKEILNVTETASDESLIDIYVRRDNLGYRILTTGFDFSCLGAEKGILAKDNIKKLAEKLTNIAPNAKFVNDYLQIRELLAKIWEVEQKSDSSGLQRSGVGKFIFGNVTTVNNLAQFTKYSRLQPNLL